MKTYIIRIKGNEKSEAAAQRCAKSLPAGYNPIFFDAITPNDNPLQILKDRGIPDKTFVEEDTKYSSLEPCVSAFLSHHSIWMKSLAEKEEMQILEHDAVCVGDLAEFIPYSKVINLGRPSYGKFKIPHYIGVGSLVSKPYFPGAHAYRVKPAGAKALIAETKNYARTTDVFLDIRRFPWLQEYHPWPFAAKDDFTTLQKETGCIAKHGYNEDYEILT